MARSLLIANRLEMLFGMDLRQTRRYFVYADHDARVSEFEPRKKSRSKRVEGGLARRYGEDGDVHQRLLSSPEKWWMLTMECEKVLDRVVRGHGLNECGLRDIRHEELTFMWLETYMVHDWAISFHTTSHRPDHKASVVGHSAARCKSRQTKESG